MATKKKTPTTPATNGAPATGPPEIESKSRRKTSVDRERLIQSIKDRADRMRAVLDEMQGDWVGWHHLIGSHADAPEAFEEAMRLGREWRESFRPDPGPRESRPVDGDS